MKLPWDSTSGGLAASLTHWLYYKTSNVSEPWDRPDASRMLKVEHQGVPGAYYIDQALFGVIKLFLSHRLTILEPSKGDLERLHTSCSWLAAGAGKATPATMEEVETQEQLANLWNKPDEVHGPFVTEWQMSIKKRHQVNLPDCSARMGMKLEPKQKALLDYLVKGARMSEEIWLGLTGTPLEFMGVGTNRVASQGQLVSALVTEVSWRKARLPTFFAENPGWAWLLTQSLLHIRSVPGLEHYKIWQHMDTHLVQYTDEPITPELLKQITVQTSKSEGRKRVDMAVGRLLDSLCHMDVAGIPVKELNRDTDGRKAGKTITHMLLHPEVFRMSMLLRNTVLQIAMNGAETRLNEDTCRPHTMENVGDRMLGVPRDCAIQVRVAPPKVVHQFYRETEVKVDNLADIMPWNTTEVDEQEDMPGPEEESGALRAVRVPGLSDDGEGTVDDIEAMEHEVELSGDDDDNHDDDEPMEEEIHRNRVDLGASDRSTSGSASTRQTPPDVFMAQSPRPLNDSRSPDHMDIDIDSEMDYDPPHEPATPVYPPRARHRQAPTHESDSDGISQDKVHLHRPHSFVQRLPNSSEDEYSSDLVGRPGHKETNSDAEVDEDMDCSAHTKPGYLAGSESEGQEETAPTEDPEASRCCEHTSTPPPHVLDKPNTSMIPSATASRDLEVTLPASVSASVEHPDIPLPSDDMQEHSDPDVLPSVTVAGSEILSNAGAVEENAPPPVKDNRNQGAPTQLEQDLPVEDPQPAGELHGPASHVDAPVNRSDDEEVISDSQNEYSPLAPSAQPLPPTAAAEPRSPLRELSGVLDILGSINASNAQFEGTPDLQQLISRIHASSPELVPAPDGHTTSAQEAAPSTSPTPVPPLDDIPIGGQFAEVSMPAIRSIEQQVETAVSQVESLSISQYPGSNQKETTELANAINQSFGNPPQDVDMQDATETSQLSSYRLLVPGPFAIPPVALTQGPQDEDDELDYSNEDDDLFEAQEMARKAQEQAQAAPSQSSVLEQAKLVPAKAATPSTSDSDSSLGKRNRATAQLDNPARSTRTSQKGSRSDRYAKRSRR
jgi:hypothetical protein